MASSSAEDQIKDIARNDAETKCVIRERLTNLKEMNLATRAELAKTVIIDYELIKTAFEIAGDRIVDLSIDNEVKDEKIVELEKHVGKMEKERINTNMQMSKKRKMEDSRRDRLARELNIAVSKGKQLVDK